ncbi:UNVERIFIED_CONTAM: hypothetical protein Slati_1514500 [Sesamum latifolium]|uniref:Reverse transcriptase domain-containing protein n=1 Tax=Sesamum latifolium TaxID=2727402 RepID=A0AAW2X9F6_9LAMI
MEENQEFTNPDQVKNLQLHTSKTYSHAIRSEECPRLPISIPPSLRGNHRNICNLPTDKEIKDTVFSIDKDSIAGPNGFSSAFYQACWEFIATDINEAVKDFFCGTPMRRNFTATTIVLIPKVDSPQTWNDFRPISLCNVTNKILSKLLYNKLSQTLPDLISPSQSGFVPGRLIGDNILMAQVRGTFLRYVRSMGILTMRMKILKG